MKIRLKKIIKFTLILALSAIIYSFFFTLYENIKINNMLNEFKERAIFDFEIERTYQGSTYLRRYNKVSRETSYEDDGQNVFYDNEKNNIGIAGDIFVTRQSPFPEFFGFHQFMSFYFGGHAALKIDEKRVVESVGFPEPNESIFDIIFSNGNKGHGYSPIISYASSSYWMNASPGGYYFDRYYRDRYIGLRIKEENNNKDIKNEIIETAIDISKEKYDNEALYNFLFFLNMQKKYYCTDLVSRVYDEAYTRIYTDDKEYKSKGYAKRLNDDGFITSVNDLILSKDTYIHFYVEINEETVDNKKMIIENYYYLEDYLEV